MCSAALFSRPSNGCTRLLKSTLQALFIARRTYPIAYDKWIREQVVEILGLPELHPQMVHLLEIDRLESDELIQKAETVESWIGATIENL